MSAVPELNRSLITNGTISQRAAVSLPAANTLNLPERAIQFGTGGFLRGFVEYFIDNANLAGMFNGRVVAVSSTGSGRDERLRSQDCLYTLAVQGVEHGVAVRDHRIVGSLSRTISAVDDWAAVLEMAESPALAVVFSNTTEVGIAFDAGDSIDLSPPRSFPGKLTAFLHHRAEHFKFSGGSLAVIPCELIDDNGDKLREIVVGLAGRWNLDPRFVKWLCQSVNFCNTLVDRIVSGTPPEEQLNEIAQQLGYSDSMLTVCEPYRLFAIEPGNADADSLSWAKADAGVLLTDDVAPYRERKVRLLNGAHTILVPLALLSGHDTVYSAVEDESIGSFLRLAMLDEIAPMLDAPHAEEFALDVLERFGNPFIEHFLFGITLYGTMKMAVRVVPSILAYFDKTGRVPSALSFGFAAYLLFMRGDLQAERRAAGVAVPPDDKGGIVTKAWQSEANARAVTEKVCANETLWGTDLTRIDGFIDNVTGRLESMLSEGVGTALNDYLKDQLAFRATS